MRQIVQLKSLPLQLGSEMLVSSGSTMPRRSLPIFFLAGIIPFCNEKGSRPGSHPKTNKGSTPGPIPKREEGARPGFSPNRNKVPGQGPAPQGERVQGQGPVPTRRLFKARAQCKTNSNVVPPRSPNTIYIYIAQPVRIDVWHFHYL
jgi:hypothetical protein